MSVTGYVRQSSGLIVTGQTIQASHFNNEYNAIETAFSSTSGHTHDGTAGGGAPIVPTSLTSLSSNGMVARVSATAFAARTITGTADTITVTNGDGVSGNPTLTIAATYVGQASITTLGTIATGVWQGTKVDITYGGTNATTASAARTNLGLAIGTDVQGFNAGLSVYAAAINNGTASPGFVTLTANNTLSVRTITGTADRITLTNGSGVSGAPTIDIAGTYVGQSSITTLGTVTTGTWSATAVAATVGGTGITTYSQGDVIYSSASNTLSKLSKDTNATRYLSNTGTSNNPAWSQVALATGVSGSLPYANLTQGSARSVLGVTGNATADVASIQGTADQILRINGAGTALAFGSVDLSKSAAVGTSVLPVANGGTGLATLTANNVLLGNGASNPTFVAPGTSGNVLTSNGTTWQSTAAANTVKAWATFDGTTGTISASSGVTSVTRNTIGTYTVVLSSAQADTNYATILTTSFGTGGGAVAFEDEAISKTTTGFGIGTFNLSGVRKDNARVYFAVLR